MSQAFAFGSSANACGMFISGFRCSPHAQGSKEDPKNEEHENNEACRGFHFFSFRATEML